eukprot:Stramenopile-MAST_4_protein_912
MATNLNPSILNRQVHEIADTIDPEIVNVTIDYNDGKLIGHMSETIDLMVASKINRNKLFLANQSEEESVSLFASEVFLEEFALTFTLILTETSRVEGIKRSGTMGGDGGPLYLYAKSGAVVDIAQNEQVKTSGIIIYETEDTTSPTFVSCSLNYGIGSLVIVASETIDATPADLVLLGNIYLSQTGGSNDLQLHGAKVIAIDALRITIILSETQRVAALVKSGTPGGDNSSLVLDIYHGALQDIAMKKMQTIRNNSITEIRDWGQATGILVLRASETIDTTPSSFVVTADIAVVNVSVGNEYVSMIPLNNAVVTEADGVLVTIQMTELQRVAAIAASSTPGGDGVGAMVDVKINAVRDVATNFVNATQNVLLNETGDTILPVPQNATLNFSTGVLIAKDGTVKLIVRPLTTGILDGAGIRTILFSPSTSNPGDHIFNMVILSQAILLDEILSVSPASDLVDGCVYEFILEYQDLAGNSKVAVLHDNVAFAGKETLPFALSNPKSGISIPNGALRCSGG